MTSLTNRLIARLLTMLAYRRPYGSRAISAFVERWILPLGCQPDGLGNYATKIGSSRVIFTAHLDTAHSDGGSRPVAYDGRYARSRDTEPIGADDTIGCFLMAELIRRRIPGTYYFHDGEELGCIGSGALIGSDPDWLKMYDAVISLDRRGIGDVITHQCGSRTCSDPFATAIADLLNDQGLTYAPSDRGLFTDSEQYSRIVPECTNLSVGFLGEHSSSEIVDLDHVLHLLDALSDADLGSADLPIVRDPSTYYSEIFGDPILDPWYVDQGRYDPRVFSEAEYRARYDRHWDDRQFLDPAYGRIYRALLGD